MSRASAGRLVESIHKGLRQVHAVWFALGRLNSGAGVQEVICGELQWLIPTAYPVFTPASHLPPEPLGHGCHGGIAAELLQIVPGVTLGACRDRGEVVCPFDPLFAQEGLEDALALQQARQPYSECPGHPPQDGAVDVVRAVCCPNNYNLPGAVRGETVPKGHELGLDLRTRLVVR